MYDEKYLEGVEAKEIATVEDAVAILTVSKNFCEHIHCRLCPVRQYETRKGQGCSRLQSEAKAFLAGKKLYGKDKETEKKVIEAYNRIVERVPEPKQETAPDEPASKTCLGCLKARRHESGILFCESFGNFTHEDGYCYRFEPSDMIDETACG